MSSFNPLSYSEIVANQESAVSAAGTPLINFNPGSVVAALIQANAGNSLWLQGLIAYVISINRLATSTGVNVDTFINDFGYTRPPASSASGTVTMSRYTSSIAAVINGASSIDSIPAPALISSSVTQQQYFVTVDVANPYWDPLQNAYILPIGYASINVPIQAVIPGINGNAQIGQIDTINSAITAIDTVINSAQIINGTDAASDSQTKIDFVLYLASLFRATEQAIEFAITQVKDVVRYSLVENLTHPSGDPDPGFFYAVIDDGTGSPSGTLITEVYNSIAFYRGLTIHYAVYAPSVTNVTIVVSVKTNLLELTATVQANVKAALVEYVNTLSFGINLYYTRVAQVCYDADPSVIDVFSYTVNSGTSDLVGSVNGIFLTNTGSITVNVNP